MQTVDTVILVAAANGRLDLNDLAALNLLIVGSTTKVSRWGRQGPGNLRTHASRTPRVASLHLARQPITELRVMPRGLGKVPAEQDGDAGVGGGWGGAAGHQEAAVGGDIVVGVGRRALERACHETCGLHGAMQGIVLHGNTDPSIIEEAFLAQLGRAPTAAEFEAVFIESHPSLKATWPLASRWK